MVYLYDACDQLSDFCHQQWLRKMRRKISWMDGRTEVKQYTPPPPSGSGGIITPIPEALKSLYRSPGNKKNQLVLCKNYVLRHLGITINIKNTKFVKDLPMIDAQFRFNQCNSFREEYISVFSPYGSVLILWPVVAAILDFRSA